jgi:hypothetical protein
MTAVGGFSSTVGMRTRPWTTMRSTDWWERVMTQNEFQPSDWLDKFRMSRETFFHLCDELRPRLTRQDTSLRRALPVEKRVALALWRLAGILFSTTEAMMSSRMLGMVLPPLPPYRRQRVVFTIMLGHLEKTFRRFT